MKKTLLKIAGVVIVIGLVLACSKLRHSTYDCGNASEWFACSP